MNSGMLSVMWDIQMQSTFLGFSWLQPLNCDRANICYIELFQLFLHHSRLEQSLNHCGQRPPSVSQSLLTLILLSLLNKPSRWSSAWSQASSPGSSLVENSGLRWRRADSHLKLSDLQLCKGEDSVHCPTRMYVRETNRILNCFK